MASESTDNPLEQAAQMLARIDERQKGFAATMTQVQSSIASVQAAQTTLQTTLSKIEGQDVAAKVTQLATKHETDEGRIRALENWRYWIMGGLAVLGLALAYVLKRLP